MTAPDFRRLLFFASETAVLGCHAATFYYGGRAKYIDPIIPVYVLGFVGLLVFSLGCINTLPALAKVGFITLGLSILLDFFVTYVVE